MISSIALIDNFLYIGIISTLSYKINCIMFKVKIVALFSPKGIFVLLIKDVVANKAKQIPQLTY